LTSTTPQDSVTPNPSFKRTPNGVARQPSSAGVRLTQTLGRMTPTSLPVRIRAYTAADKNACLGVFDSNLPTYFDLTERTEFEDFLAAPDADYFVAVAEDIVVGCGGYVAEGTEGRLCWGMVHSTKHGSSIGSALMSWRLRLLFSLARIETIGIETSQHSAGFFQKCGFVTRHVQVDGFGVGIDRVEMSLSRRDWQSRSAQP
jgi:Acetyltransferase (GNAT) family